MGRFPWKSGHSKQGSDKISNGQQEWLAKTVEPSRQALTELMKEYSTQSSLSDDSSSNHVSGRSRANTISSAISYYARSTSEHSNELASRPASRQSILLDRSSSPNDRSENSARNLLSKGSRLLKRQGSKFNLLSGPIEASTSTSTEDNTLTLVRSQGSPVRATEIRSTQFTRRPTIKQSISGPFGFQHVTHTEQRHFQSIDRVSTTEFAAIQADQRPNTEIRGIPVGDLPVNKLPDFNNVDWSDSTAKEQSDLPLTPPRPSPPPKDNPRSPASPTDIRMSRSMENFSRPTRSPMASFDSSFTQETTNALSTVISHPGNTAHADAYAYGSLSADHPSLLSASPNIESADTKPLPLTPDVVHAVSTGDDSALLLRTAPLPQPPMLLTDVPEEEEEGQIKVEALLRQTRDSARVSLRHMATCPTLNSQITRSKSSNDLDNIDNAMQLPSSFSMTHLQKFCAQPQHTSSRKRISIGLKTIDIDNWEDVVDYSWDHLTEEDCLERALEADAAVVGEASPNVGAIGDLSVNNTPSESSSCKPSPLMIRPRSQSKVAEAPLPSPTVGHNIMPKPLVIADHESAQLLGLGIDSINNMPSANRCSLPESINDTHFGFPMPAIRREPGSPISKSSSQESIILSIASSILGTHRSSNSSTSFSDLAQLTDVEEAFGKDDIPTTIESNEGHSSDSSQDTVRTDQKPSICIPLQDVPEEVAQQHKHERAISGSCIAVPSRTSSIAGAGLGRQTTRKRANTVNSRPRHQSRASYSLFPTPKPVPTS